MTSAQAKELKVGDQVQMVGDYSASMKKGQIVFVSKTAAQSGYSNGDLLYVAIDSSGRGETAVNPQHIDPVPGTDREQLERKVTDAERALTAAKARLEYWDEVKPVKFDENEFKSYQVAKIVRDPNISAAEAAKAMADFLKTVRA